MLCRHAVERVEVVIPARRRQKPRIAGEVGDVIPVAVVRQYRDHRVVRGAAAERAGARIPDAVLFRNELRIARLPCPVAVVTNEEVPAHRRALRGEGMKRRDVVGRGIGRALALSALPGA